MTLYLKREVFPIQSEKSFFLHVMPDASCHWINGSEYISYRIQGAELLRIQIQEAELSRIRTIFLLKPI